MVAEVCNILVGTGYRSPSSASVGFIVDTSEFLESIPCSPQWSLIGDLNLQPHDSIVVENLLNSAVW